MARQLNKSSAAPAPKSDTPLKDARIAQEEAGVSLRVAGVNPLAKRYAEKISQDTINEFETAINSDEYQKVVGLLFAEHIRMDFTADEINGAPKAILRADAEEYHDKHKGSNVPLDWTPVKDGKKTKWVSVFDGMLEAHPFCVAIRKDIERIDDVMTQKTGYDVELRKAYPNTREQKARKTRLEKKISTMKAKWRTGWRVVQQQLLLKDLIGDCVLYAETRNKAGELEYGPTPIYLEKVQEKGVKSMSDNFSVTSFLSLDIQKAVDNRLNDTATETWDALIATLAKEEPEQEEDPDNIVINNAKRFETGLASFLHYIKDHPETITGLVKKINGAKDVREIAPLAMTIGDLANEMWGLKQHIQKQYENAHVLEQLAQGKTVDAKTIAGAIAS